MERRTYRLPVLVTLTLLALIVIAPVVIVSSSLRLFAALKR